MSGKSYIYKYLEFLIPVYNLVKTKNMAQVDIIRNGIIDKLLAISDQDYLLALQRLINSSKVEENKITLTKEQKLMLEMSENDIQNGRVISQSDLDKSDLEWLKGK
jgi:hypothetical protein